eukprot:INCI5513.1.p1 GENE.INCI5513.1~~INCI5513.1.p1  ORF type:complete len:474 (+),score=61.00 INCI5513.1:104-1525(+)
MPAAAELKPSAAERDADGPLMVFSAMAACLFAALSALYVIAAHAENGPLAAFGIKVNCAVSLVGFLFTYFAVPTLREKFIAANLFGIDLNKSTTRRNKDGSLYRDPATNRIEGIKVPEAMGLVGSTAYLVCMFCFIPVVSLFMAEGGAAEEWFLGEFLAATLSVCCMAFLGFADNVLDLRWRQKFLLPTAASLPLLMMYGVSGGSTSILVPEMLQSTLGLELVELGFFFYVYIGMLAVFCTNSINIYAGVNGLEVGQSIVIALSILCINVLQLYRHREHDSTEMDNHLFSIFVLVPFICTSMALLLHNWFPARVFVGDTYCYFAGMTFAVVGILGHFSKTLLLLFIPQILNFLYSLPQLTKIVPCPRHRMPGFDSETGRLQMSFAEIDMATAKPITKIMVRLLEVTKLAFVERRDDSTVRMSNLTVINFVLFWVGPLREDQLTLVLLVLQTICSIIGFLIRFQFAGIIYNVVS